MKFIPLDTVVLVHDVPQHRLRAGDVGAVVEVYDNGTLEALVTLRPSDVRSVTKTDVLCVRPS